MFVLFQDVVVGINHFAIVVEANALFDTGKHDCSAFVCEKTPAGRLVAALVMIMLFADKQELLVEVIGGFGVQIRVVFAFENALLARQQGCFGNFAFFAFRLFSQKDFEFISFQRNFLLDLYNDYTF